MRTMLMGMKLLAAVVWLSVAMALSFGDAAAQSSGEFNGFKYGVKGLLRPDWALSTSGEPNPNNIGALSTRGNSWNLMGYRFESWIKLDAEDGKAGQLGLDGFSALIHPRFFADLAP